MVKKHGSIIVFISILSLITLTASCRQHRTPKSISFKRTTSSNSRQSDVNTDNKESVSQEEFYILDSIFQICIPAPIDGKAEQIIQRKAYKLSYNKETKNPNWVAWHLTAEHSDGSVPRSNDYREDFDVPSPRATNEDYKNVSWTRGHLCPAGDNKWDSRAMSESFLLSNISPQASSLNTGLWNKIEQSCRDWAKLYGDLYIVCGPLFLNREHEKIGDHGVYVPEAFFKVILCLQGEPKALGFIIRNNDGKKKRDQFLNTVDEVERITGIDFFPALPDSIENKVEAYSNLEDWK